MICPECHLEIFGDGVHVCPDQLERIVHEANNTSSPATLQKPAAPRGELADALGGLWKRPRIQKLLNFWSNQAINLIWCLMANWFLPKNSRTSRITGSSDG